MKSLVKAKAEPGIWLQDIDEPTYGDNEVLIKIKKTAICGTDMHIYHWDEWSQKTVKVPMTIGHEFAGEIVAIGKNVKGLHIGQRVSGEGHIVCGQCRHCRAGTRHLCPNTVGLGYDCPGAFAEYLAFPGENVFPLPDDISDDMAAIFDPYGNAAHTALSFNLVGEDVLITGAGPVGLLAIPIARHVGARHIVVTDVNEYRLELARQLGATLAVNANTFDFSTIKKQLNMQEGFDIGFEMSGNSQAFRSLIQSMTSGGRIALLGIVPNSTLIDWDKVIFKSLFIKGIYGREMYDTWYKMASMLQSGLDISKVITHHFPVDDYQQAFDVMASGQSGKVILHWE